MPREPLQPDEPREGCALCGSTWGDHWEAIEGVERFFCCSVCAAAYGNLVEAIEAATGWDRVDRLFLDDNRGDEAGGWARQGDGRVRFDMAGTYDGTVTRFELVEN